MTYARARYSRPSPNASAAAAAANTSTEATTIVRPRRPATPRMYPSRRGVALGGPSDSRPVVGELVALGFRVRARRRNRRSTPPWHLGPPSPASFTICWTPTRGPAARGRGSLSVRPEACGTDSQWQGSRSWRVHTIGIAPPRLWDVWEGRARERAGSQRGQSAPEVSRKRSGRRRSTAWRCPARPAHGWENVQSRLGWTGKTASMRPRSRARP
jgi:hypothetical protein